MKEFFMRFYPHNRRETLRFWTLLLLICAIILFLVWFLFYRNVRTTDDAYVNGNRVNITSVIGGTPIAFFADNTDYVREGDLLILLDKTPYEVTLQKELATLANVAQRVSEMEASVRSKKAALAQAEIAMQKADYDLQNRKPLIESRAISGEELVHAEDSYRSTKAAFDEALHQLQMAESLRGEGPIEEHPLLLHQMSICKKAFYDLFHTKIVAPCSGNIAQRAVQVGQWTSPSQFLMAIIPQDPMWIDANFKETELTYMRVGQKAEVTIDLYGSKLYLNGEVQGIASGTGSVFSLIPPQNATGNWIKIVQRLPVRIALDPKQYKDFPLRLGLSSTVSVDIANQDLPYLVTQPSATTPKAETHVFAIDFTSIEIKMRTILHQNLFHYGQ